MLKVNLKVEQNADKFLKTLLEHIKKREDIEELATLLNYDPAQMETDIEDFVTLIREYRSRFFSLSDWA